MPADRATTATWRAAARALGIPLSVLRRLRPPELERLLCRARRRAERDWHLASLRIDALVALGDLLREGRR
ncbi:MAG: hypothetical protein NZ554_14095 [Bryobacteraceae bacterium]|nr:hypothetical protein [Bryobacteraceae bacterium]